MMLRSKLLDWEYIFTSSWWHHFLSCHLFTLRYLIKAKLMEQIQFCDLKCVKSHSKLCQFHFITFIFRCRFAFHFFARFCFASFCTFVLFMCFLCHSKQKRENNFIIKNKSFAITRMDMECKWNLDYSTEIRNAKFVWRKKSSNTNFGSIMFDVKYCCNPKTQWFIRKKWNCMEFTIKTSLWPWYNLNSYFHIE